MAEVQQIQDLLCLVTVLSPGIPQHMEAAVYTHVRAILVWKEMPGLQATLYPMAVVAESSTVEICFQWMEAVSLKIPVEVYLSIAAMQSD